ncbi:MAG TPA: HD domain-containing protein [Lachnospiraceae bacterium]|nr:HD domain-containing protein [Lachnospiraceae bacterium]
MYPSREEAEKILIEAESCNPGPWGDHSRVAAGCAEKIAMLCEDIDSSKAYVLGLLHDIGRKFGTRHLGHVYDGYQYMLRLGYDEVAQICLTHSFCNHDLKNFIGNLDINKEKQGEVEKALEESVFDDYDRLIQLCDCLAGANSVLDMVERMEDVKQRYGNYPQDKWIMNLGLKTYFEDKTGKNLYEIVDLK